MIIVHADNVTINFTCPIVNRNVKVDITDSYIYNLDNLDKVVDVDCYECNLIHVVSLGYSQQVALETEVKLD